MSVVESITEDTPVTFFQGKTFDGCHFVISVIGGDTADDPGEASGVIRAHDGTRIRIPKVSAAMGCALKGELPIYDASEVLLALRDLQRLN